VVTDGQQPAIAAPGHRFVPNVIGPSRQCPARFQVDDSDFSVRPTLNGVYGDPPTARVEANRIWQELERHALNLLAIDQVPDEEVLFRRAENHRLAIGKKDVGTRAGWLMEDSLPAFQVPDVQKLTGRASISSMWSRLASAGRSASIS
jgi:hypothetical protein